MDFNEELLYYIWRHRYFDYYRLATTEHEEIKSNRIRHPHTNAGPDFIQAKIQIGATLWAGNVECI
jgi:hypothetical protein